MGRVKEVVDSRGLKEGGCREDDACTGGLQQLLPSDMCVGLKKEEGGRLPSRAGRGESEGGGGAGGLRAPSRPFEAGQISNTALAPSLA